MAHTTRRTVEVSVRSSPKYSVFVGLGIVLGLLVALAVWGLTALGVVEPDLTDPSAAQSYASGSSLWLLMVLSAVFFGFVGAIVALVLDRRSVKRARTYEVPAEYREYRVVQPDPEDEVQVVKAVPVQDADGAAEEDAAEDDTGGVEGQGASAADPEDGTDSQGGSDGRSTV
ncbi:hypothetical protein [Brevibacterium litoralis]|uniref:hypothetical protein n=1 Tax=Brevibacterium litoralis TaxID=3138935 RepID=UPI0032EB8F67